MRGWGRHLYEGEPRINERASLVDRGELGESKALRSTFIAAQDGEDNQRQWILHTDE